MTRHASCVWIVTCAAACTGDPSGADTGPRGVKPGDTARVTTRIVNPAELEPLLVDAEYDCRGVRDDTVDGPAQYPVPTPPFSPDVYPCTRCHDQPDDANPTPRNLLAAHLDINLVHGSREQWCYDCHNPTDRDKLRLAGGRLISFETSYELCGQCHGEKLRDWRRGVHGRRTGCWNGARAYLLCVNCHSPHAPKFKSMHPRPRPPRPSEIQLSRRSAP